MTYLGTMYFGTSQGQLPARLDTAWGAASGGRSGCCIPAPLRGRCYLREGPPTPAPPPAGGRPEGVTAPARAGCRRAAGSFRPPTRLCTAGFARLPPRQRPHGAATATAPAAERDVAALAPPAPRPRPAGLALSGHRRNR